MKSLQTQAPVNTPIKMYSIWALKASIKLHRLSLFGRFTYKKVKSKQRRHKYLWASKIASNLRSISINTTSERKVCKGENLAIVLAYNLCHLSSVVQFSSWNETIYTVESRDNWEKRFQYSVRSWITQSYETYRITIVRGWQKKSNISR